MDGQGGTPNISLKRQGKQAVGPEKRPKLGPHEELMEFPANAGPASVPPSQKPFQTIPGRSEDHAEINRLATENQHLAAAKAQSDRIADTLTDALFRDIALPGGDTYNAVMSVVADQTPHSPEYQDQQKIAFETRASLSKRI